MLDLDFSFIGPALPLLWKGMVVTLKITCVGILVGIIWGTILAVARSSPFWIFRTFSKFYVNVFRSVPLVMVLLWFFLIAPGVIDGIVEILPDFVKNIFQLSAQSDSRFLSAMVAFSMFEAAYYSEIIRAGISSISQGQMQAALGLGMTRGQALRLIVLPQAFKVMTPLLLTQGIILFQDTALVIVIGLNDFFSQSRNIGITFGSEIEAILFAGTVYFVICSSLSLLVYYLKSRKTHA